MRVNVLRSVSTLAGHGGLSDLAPDLVARMQAAVRANGTGHRVAYSPRDGSFSGTAPVADRNAVVLASAAKIRRHGS